MPPSRVAVNPFEERGQGPTVFLSCLFKVDFKFSLNCLLFPASERASYGV